MGDWVFAAQLAALIAAVLVLRWALLYLAERYLGPRRKHARAPLTRVSAISEGQRCRVVGVARAHPEHPAITARFTGRPALIYEGELRKHDRTSDSENPHRCEADEVHAVALFCVEDETGSVAVRPLVPGAGRMFELQKRARMEMVPMDQVEALLAADGRQPADLEEGFPWGWSKLPSDYHVDEAVLQEGQRVVVVGVPRAEASAAGAARPGYRETPTQLRLVGDGENALYLTNLEPLVKRLAR